MPLGAPLTTCQTGDSLCVLSACIVTRVYLSLRLSAGRHQAYHLSWRAQDRSVGRGQHRHHPERGLGGAGVPSQKRADSSVSSNVTRLQGNALLSLYAVLVQFESW